MAAKGSCTGKGATYSADLSHSSFPSEDISEITGAGSVIFANVTVRKALHPATLMGMAQAIAHQPHERQRLQSMLGLVRERTRWAQRWLPVLSVAALLESFPGGADACWTGWLSHKQIPGQIPIQHVLATHAAHSTSPFELNQLRKELDAHLTAGDLVSVRGLCESFESVIRAGLIRLDRV